MKPFQDPKTQQRQETRRFLFLIWIVIIASLVGVWVLYDRVEWVRALLGTSRGTVRLGIPLLASPIILFMYLLEKLRK